MRTEFKPLGASHEPQRHQLRRLEIVQFFARGFHRSDPDLKIDIHLAKILLTCSRDVLRIPHAGRAREIAFPSSRDLMHADQSIRSGSSLKAAGEDEGA